MNIIETVTIDGVVNYAQQPLLFSAPQNARERKIIESITRAIEDIKAYQSKMREKYPNPMTPMIIPTTETFFIDERYARIPMSASIIEKRAFVRKLNTLENVIRNPKTMRLIINPVSNNS